MGRVSRGKAVGGRPLNSVVRQHLDTPMRELKCGPARPIERMTLRAVEKNALWCWALDEETKPGRDETWLYPVSLSVIPKGGDTFVVAATATFSNGQSMPALMEVVGAGEPESFCTPVVLFWGGKCLGFGGQPYSANKLKKATKLPLSDLFPIQWRLSVRIKGERTFHHGVEHLMTEADIEANKRWMKDFLAKLRTGVDAA